jgi:hypothetical protein
VREQVGESFVQGLVSKPEIHPEGRGSPISQGDLGDGAKGSKTDNNILPDGGVQVVAVPQVTGAVPPVHPAKPGCPGGRVDFCEKFREKGRVLGGEGNDPQPAIFFRDADVFPSHLALASIASFLSGPEESPASLIDGLDNTGREESYTHGMGQHRGEYRVDEEKATSNGEYFFLLEIRICNVGAYVHLIRRYVCGGR